MSHEARADGQAELASFSSSISREQTRVGQPVRPGLVLGCHLWPPTHLSRDKRPSRGFRSPRWVRPPEPGSPPPPPPPRRGAWRRSPPLRASEPRTAGRTGGLLGFLSFSRAATCYSGDQASAAPGIPSRSRVAGGACHSPWCQPRDPAACSWENGRRPWPGPSGRGSSCGVLWAQSRGGFSGLAPCPGGQPGSGSPVLGPGKPGGRAGPGGRGGACLPGVGRRPRA